jgi:hypothetical protein
MSGKNCGCDENNTDTLCWGCLRNMNMRAAVEMRRAGALPEVSDNFEKAAAECQGVIDAMNKAGAQA